MNRRPALLLALYAVSATGGGARAHAEGPHGGMKAGGMVLAAPPAASAGTTTVSVDAAQSTLTLGVDEGTTLVVTVAGPLAAQAVPGRTQATVGTVGPLVPRSTAGSFTAEYRVPGDQIPQSAIISVEVTLPGGGRAYATTQLLLPAATTFPFRTSPSATVSLEVAGRLFGPRKADGEGNVSIPIIVPPHVAVGRARAVNKFGIATETDVGLQPQDYPRVLLVAPPDAEAGATIDVEVWAVVPSGDPAPPEEIDLHASGGSVRRLGGMPGLARFAFTVPAQVGPGAVGLLAAMDDGTSVRPDAVILRAGPPSEVVIASDLKRLVVGSPTVAHLKAVAQDRFGNAVPVQGLTLTADGQPLPVKLTSGEGSAAIPAPATWTGRDHVAVQATLGRLRGAIDLLVTGGSPARANLVASRPTVEGNGANSVQFVLELFDQKGTPTSATRVLWQTGDDGRLDTLPAMRFGTYAVRFVPRRTLRDRTARVAVTIDSVLQARGQVRVQASASRAAAARVGLMSNLGGSFGQSAFLEATVPLRHAGRGGRLFSAGLTAGYLHSEADASAAGTVFPSVHLNVNQTPLLLLVRARLPAPLPVELSLSAAAGVTFAWTTIIPDSTAYATSRGSAHALALGGGLDASMVLQPGELVIGAHYLHAHLGRNSNGDQIDGNALGLICDLGFRMAF